METDIKARSYLTKFLNRINNAMRKTRCRSNNQNGVSINEFSDRFDICLELFIYRDTPELD
ncbi:hypothetical protein T11_15337, partial [Trichinella zimbabwensis]